MKQDSSFIAMLSSFGGALSAAIVFGFWVRDRVFTYLRQQNADLFTEITNLTDEIRSIRAHQHETALHLFQQDKDADRHANDVIKATSEVAVGFDPQK